MNVRSPPGRWAENLTPWEAQAEPVRLGDHEGRGRREHDGSAPSPAALLRGRGRTEPALVDCGAGAA